MIGTISPATIDTLLETENWATLLDESERAAIAGPLLQSIEDDDESRSEWLRENEEWLKLAMQVKEEKSTPWPKAANVKYPLLTVASMQFHARAQQALMKGSLPVKSKVLGLDPDGAKADKGERISKFLSYLIQYGMEDWEDEMDRLLLVLPIIGMAFKKTYWSPSREQPRSELVLPQDLILNYGATDFVRARRTHRMMKYQNEVIELQRSGYFLSDVALGEPVVSEDHQKQFLTVDMDGHGAHVETRPIYESHCWLDLDKDGYSEPYIVTLDKQTGSMLRLTPRFGEKAISFNQEKQVQRIEAQEYFTRFIFLPDVLSKLYGKGLGNLLGPTNEGVNTVMNQLIDAGTSSVLNSGFLGRGVRLPKGGPMRLGPNEWRVIDSRGDDIKKAILPLPRGEPSPVLFSLLGQLIESGSQIGSLADIMMGQNPGQNQPYSTTVQVLEQGMKVFVGIYKRIYRAQAKEYRILHGIAMEHSGPVYVSVLDDPAATPEDFDLQGLDVVPVSDPDMVSEGQRLLKSESLLQKLGGGLPLNVEEVTRRVLEAEDHENIDVLMQRPPPQPDFETQFKMQQHSETMQLEWAKLALEHGIAEAEKLKDLAQAAVNMAKAKAVGTTSELSLRKAQGEEEQSMVDAYLERKRIEVEEKKASGTDSEESDEREAEGEI